MTAWKQPQQLKKCPSASVVHNYGIAPTTGYYQCEHIKEALWGGKQIKSGRSSSRRRGGRGIGENTEVKASGWSLAAIDLCAPRHPV